jgi:hypothetical protein
LQGITLGTAELGCIQEFIEMQQLVLRHHAELDGSNPTISVIYQDPTTFQQETVGPFPFALDFSEEDRELLRWYLEEYLQCPLAVYRERALQAEARMETLSAALFEAVFKERAAYDLYRNVRDTLSQTRMVVQANTASGIALPWELIRDPGQTYGDLAYQAHSFVRGEPNIPKTVAPSPQGSTLNILLAISRPDDEKDVAFQSVARHLLDAFENQPGRVNIEVLRPATFTELSRRLQEKPNHYHVFHFDGHGTFMGAPASSNMLYKKEGLGGKLYFEDGLASGKEEDGLISGERLGRALAQARVPIVLLNACQSGMTDPESGLISLGNELLRSGACGVVAMSYSVYVQTAAAFMKSLYERLRAGDDLAGAHKKAVVALKDNPKRRSTLGTEENLQDWIVPVLFERVAVTPLTKTAGGSGTGSETTNKTAEFALPKPPEYGFHGRDTITLKLERAFQSNTVALLWGMAGVGKTTTATAFARWYARTGALEGPVFFFSFEQHKTLSAVIREIGGFMQPLLKANGIEWEHLSEPRKRRCVLDLLTQIPCFVIFDNFEPVSGFPTGTPSVWTDAEQTELREFLSDLMTRKAASKVLVTSRRKAEPVVPACPIVPLGGLPRHEALELAGAILTRHGVNQAKMRLLPEFGDLLKFLGGNPLSLQVILPLLADGTKPEALLARLQAGTLSLSLGKPQQHRHRPPECRRTLPGLRERAGSSKHFRPRHRARRASWTERARLGTDSLCRRRDRADAGCGRGLLQRPPRAPVVLPRKAHRHVRRALTRSRNALCQCLRAVRIVAFSDLPNQSADGDELALCGRSELPPRAPALSEAAARRSDLRDSLRRKETMDDAGTLGGVRAAVERCRE